MHLPKVLFCLSVLVVPTSTLAGSRTNADASPSVKQTRQGERASPYFSQGQNIGGRGSNGSASSAPSGLPRSISRLPTFSPDFNRDHGGTAARSAQSPHQAPAFSQGFSGALGESPPPALGSVPPPTAGRPNFAAAPAPNNAQVSGSSGYSGQRSNTETSGYHTTTYQLPYSTGAAPPANQSSSNTAPAGSYGYTGQSDYTAPNSYTGSGGYSTTTYATPPAPTLPYSTAGSPPTYSDSGNSFASPASMPTYTAASTYAAPIYGTDTPVVAPQPNYPVVPSTAIGMPAVPNYAPGGHAIIPQAPAFSPSFSNPSSLSSQTYVAPSYPNGSIPPAINYAPGGHAIVPQTPTFSSSFGNNGSAHATSANTGTSAQVTGQPNPIPSGGSQFRPAPQMTFSSSGTGSNIPTQSITGQGGLTSVGQIPAPTVGRLQLTPLSPNNPSATGETEVFPKFGSSGLDETTPTVRGLPSTDPRTPEQINEDRRTVVEVIGAAATAAAGATGNEPAAIAIETLTETCASACFPDAAR